MISETHLIIILCGAGTFLLRFLPIWQLRRKTKISATSGAIQRFLQGIGPAAITALLTVSLWPAFAGSQGSWPIFATVLALSASWLLKKIVGGIAGPTIAGAIVYGLLMHYAGIA